MLLLSSKCWIVWTKDCFCNVPCSLRSVFFKNITPWWSKSSVLYNVHWHFLFLFCCLFQLVPKHCCCISGQHRKAKLTATSSKSPLGHNGRKKEHDMTITHDHYAMVLPIFIFEWNSRFDSPQKWRFLCMTLHQASLLSTVLDSMMAKFSNARILVSFSCKRS